MPFPRMLRIRQKFPRSAPLDIPGALKEQFAARHILASIAPGARIAVAAGSRGITNLALIVKTVVDILLEAGAQPFIVPAMGTHGGATPEGQRSILADYGITEASMGVAIRAAMETRVLGQTADGVPVHFSVDALDSQGIVVINRIKPHTDFRGAIAASGMLKMVAIGLAKRNGAEVCHAAAARLGHERIVLSAARIALKHIPLLCGVGIVEDQFHQTAKIRVVPAASLEQEETVLLAEARACMPSLPFDDVDLLIVDRLGKNISGTGMDTNIIGRGVQGYTSSLIAGDIQPPVIRRIFLRDLTPETHGNAVGIGNADFTTTRVVQKMDRKASYINSLTAITPLAVKIPAYFDTDHEAIERAIGTLALPAGTPVKAIRIRDTLSVENVLVSEAYASLLAQRQDLERVSDPEEMVFDETGNMAE